jgi:hypothetical protein
MVMKLKYGYYWVKYDCYKVVIAEWTENKDGDNYWTFIGDNYEYEKDMCEVISFIPQP